MADDNDIPPVPKKLRKLDPESLERHRVVLEIIRTSAGVITVILSIIIIILNVYNIWYR